jgi:hypothetical protein
LFFSFQNKFAPICVAITSIEVSVLVVVTSQLLQSEGKTEVLLFSCEIKTSEEKERIRSFFFEIHNLAQ